MPIFIDADDDRDSSLGELEDVTGNRGSEGEMDDGEDEPWGGFGGGSENDFPASTDQAESHPGQEEKRRNPATGEELRVIKDATDLFRSSSFKLQVGSVQFFSKVQLLTQAIAHWLLDRCTVTQRPSKIVTNSSSGSFSSRPSYFPHVSPGCCSPASSCRRTHTS